MLKRTLLALLLVSVSLFAACSSGGAVGDSCTTPGVTSQCDSGNICGTDQNNASVCLKICTAQTDCATTENCNGVANSNLKACQPKQQTAG